MLFFLCVLDDNICIKTHKIMFSEKRRKSFYTTEISCQKNKQKKNIIGRASISGNSGKINR